MHCFRLMKTRLHRLYFLLMIPLGLGLTGCLHFGNVNEGCLTGLIRTENGCQSVNMLTNSELEAANNRLSSLQNQNDSQELAIRETQRLIARIQASRRGMQDTFERPSSMSPSSVRNLSTQSSFYSNNSSNYSSQQSSMNSSIFHSDVGFKNSVGFSSGNQ